MQQGFGSKEWPLGEGTRVSPWQNPFQTPPKQTCCCPKLAQSLIAGGTSVRTYLRKGKKCCIAAVRGRSEKNVRETSCKPCQKHQNLPKHHLGPWKAQTSSKARAAHINPAYFVNTTARVHTPSKQINIDCNPLHYGINAAQLTNCLAPVCVSLNNLLSHSPPFNCL